MDVKFQRNKKEAKHSFVQLTLIFPFGKRKKNNLYKFKRQKKNSLSVEEQNKSPIYLK